MDVEFLRNGVFERFPRYCNVSTGSKPGVKEVPFTPGQLEFAEMLRDEARGFGKGFSAEMLPFGVRIRAHANVEGVPEKAFGCHLDTSPAVANEDVYVRMHHDYDGEDIVLKNGTVISTDTFPSLEKHVGDTIFTSDGTTLLGGDCKAGIAEAMTFFDYLRKYPQIKHGEIDLLFTYDEEIGLKGACLVDPMVHTNAKNVYAIDGEYGTLGVENFNAASAYLKLDTVEEERRGVRAVVRIKGNYVHPGMAKDQGFVDAFRLVPDVVEVFEAAGVGVTSIEGTAGELTLEVLADSEEALENLRLIEDARQEGTPVTYSDVQEGATATEFYNLGPLVALVEGIPYEMSAEQTEGREGYIQPNNFEPKGLNVLLRNFDVEGLEEQKKLVRGLVPDISIEDDYANVGDVLAKSPEVVDVSYLALRKAGVPVNRTSTRGGDETLVYGLSREALDDKATELGRQMAGSNIGGAGEGFHSLEEWAPLEGMVRVTQALVYMNEAFVNGSR